MVYEGMFWYRQNFDKSYSSTVTEAGHKGVMRMGGGEKGRAKGGGGGGRNGREGRERKAKKKKGKKIGEEGRKRKCEKRR